MSIVNSSPDNMLSNRSLKEKAALKALQSLSSDDSESSYFNFSSSDESDSESEYDSAHSIASKVPPSSSGGINEKKNNNNSNNSDHHQSESKEEEYISLSSLFRRDSSDPEAIAWSTQWWVFVVRSIVDKQIIQQQWIQQHQQQPSNKKDRSTTASTTATTTSSFVLSDMMVELKRLHPRASFWDSKESEIWSYQWKNRQNVIRPALQAFHVEIIIKPQLRGSRKLRAYSFEFNPHADAIESWDFHIAFLPPSTFEAFKLNKPSQKRKMIASVETTAYEDAAEAAEAAADDDVDRQSLKKQNQANQGNPSKKAKTKPPTSESHNTELSTSNSQLPDRSTRSQSSKKSVHFGCGPSISPNPIISFAPAEQQQQNQEQNHEQQIGSNSSSINQNSSSTSSNSSNSSNNTSNCNDSVPISPHSPAFFEEFLALQQDDTQLMEQLVELSQMKDRMHRKVNKQYHKILDQLIIKSSRNKQFCLSMIRYVVDLQQPNNNV